MSSDCKKRKTDNTVRSNVIPKGNYDNAENMKRYHLRSTLNSTSSKSAFLAFGFFKYPKEQQNLFIEKFVNPDPNINKSVSHDMLSQTILTRAFPELKDDVTAWDINDVSVLYEVLYNKPYVESAECDQMQRKCAAEFQKKLGSYEVEYTLPLDACNLLPESFMREIADDYQRMNNRIESFWLDNMNQTHIKEEHKPEICRCFTAYVRTTIEYLLISTIPRRGGELKDMVLHAVKSWESTLKAEIDNSKSRHLDDILFDFRYYLVRNMIVQYYHNLPIIKKRVLSDFSKLDLNILAFHCDGENDNSVISAIEFLGTKHPQDKAGRIQIIRRLMKKLDNDKTFPVDINQTLNWIIFYNCLFSESKLPIERKENRTSLPTQKSDGIFDDGSSRTRSIDFHKNGRSLMPIRKFASDFATEKLDLLDERITYIEMYFAQAHRLIQKTPNIDMIEELMEQVHQGLSDSFLLYDPSKIIERQSELVSKVIDIISQYYLKNFARQG